MCGEAVSRTLDVGVGQFQGPKMWVWGSFKDPRCEYEAVLESPGGCRVVSRTPDVGVGQF